MTRMGRWSEPRAQSVVHVASTFLCTKVMSGEEKTVPEKRVRVPLFYTCFLRLLQGSTGKTGVLAKNPVFQAGNRVCVLGNVTASCENHAWATHGTSCSSPPKVGCVW